MKASSFFTPVLFFLLHVHSCFSYPSPMNCTETSRLCTSFLAFKPNPTQPPSQNLPLLLSMFDVFPQDVTFEPQTNYTFIKKNCSCDPQTKNYFSYSTYTMHTNDGYVFDLVRDAYEDMAYLHNNYEGRRARLAGVVSVKLFCGCSNGLWNYLMSYVLREGDSVESLASRFGVSMDSIESVNGISNPDNVTVGELYYIPLNSVPGEPYPTEKDVPPTSPPAPSIDGSSDGQADHKSSHVPYFWIIGGLVIGMALIVASIILCVCTRSTCCGSGTEESHAKDREGNNSHKFHILRTASFCPGRYVCCKSRDWKQTNAESSDRHINIPKVMRNEIFDVEKPVVFSYEEILSSTDGFSDSNLIGHGTFGSVYYGVLHDQEVAIKRMTATKSKECMAEMKVLCKVHHANLVELIGYAAGEDELFLVYEYAQKGSLKNHLHDPQSKSHTPLSWIMRLQIALDAARGLEYLHEHTKTHYVHRDIKTSSILLEGSFRAKISDFGLAKLVGTGHEGEPKTTRVVGTFGYLAPEYLSDGLATVKSDVYAYGVVLFELISGKEAITRTEGLELKNTERRSLVSIMSSVLRNCPDSMSMSNMKDYIDPNLLDLYPHDCLYKLTMLAKHCVDEDPVLRPDMKQVVISLSQILLSSVEWEATLGGNSQIFSGLVQGR